MVLVFALYTCGRRQLMKKRTKKALLVILILVLIPLSFLGGYVGYMSLQYYRIDDGVKVETTNNQSEQAKHTQSFSITTYNIGFGAYDHAFSFFMDSGVMKDGTSVTGEHSRAQSEEIVEHNTAGVITEAKKLESDFYFFQEVDTKATRSYDINQLEKIEASFVDYGTSFALAFHSAYLLYPFDEPHGSVESGLATLSKYRVSENIRRQYPIDNSFITKFTDLDRCFLITRITLDNDRELVLINSHMSAYDEGGLIRSQQLEVLNTVLKEEYEKGNYVIVGGDFNHDIANSIHTFSSKQQTPEWVYSLDDTSINAHYSIARAENADQVATCRSSDMPYEKGVNYTVILDGFIISDNIKATVENVDTDFLYSDHNPVSMRFTLE